jgi:cell division transport system permease protein
MTDPQARVRRASIVPERSVASRTLMLLVAIMTFLSGVTLGAVVLVQKSAIAWSSDVGRELTIQLRPVEDENMDSNLRVVAGIAESAPGIGRVEILSLADSEKLLEPWLGEGLDLSTLAVPRLVVVEIANPASLDIAALEHDLSAIRGVTVNTHAAWRQQLNVMAGTVVFSGLLVLALIGVATVLAIIFATRGTMSSNREIVDVLHFIGASDIFIAGEFQGRFLMIGLRGGVTGGVAAIAFYVLVGLLASSFLPQAANAQIGTVFGRFTLGVEGVLAIALLAPVIAGLTAVTSRLTVRQFLSEVG